MTLPGPKELLSELVSIPSVSGEEADIAGYVAQLCRHAGIEHELVGGGVLARVARNGGPRILLTSHLDTVPVGAGWTVDPFDGTWRDGRVVARGANDAKACVVGMLNAAFEAAANRDFEGELFLALNACEETNNSGMQAVLERIDEPEAAVVGEPTNLAVVRAQAGLGVLLARWRGKACHAAHVARVEHGNALVLAAQELASFGSYASIDTGHELFDATTLVPAQLTSGVRHNVVPDEAEAVFDARLSPPHDVETCVRYLAQALPQAEIRVRSDRLKAVDTPADHPLVRLALELTANERAVGSSTMSDMALLGHVPAIKCGPGRTERSHVADEYVTEEELIAGCSFYEALTLRLAAALTEEPA